MNKLAIAALALVDAAPSRAAEPIDAGWSEVARDRDGECRLSVTGEGRFFRIAATGLRSGEPARLFLSNGDMKPLDWAVRADGRGEFARYYLPFRWHRGGDTVAVSLESGDCALFAAFDWERAGVVVR
ncbi:MAG: hypothetical protein LC648_11040 [Novosphingobium sp.]|nr:hypothetical protein [Novosphingobium sp.]